MILAIFVVLFSKFWVTENLIRFTNLCALLSLVLYDAAWDIVQHHCGEICIAYRLKSSMSRFVTRVLVCTQEFSNIGRNQVALSRHTRVRSDGELSVGFLDFQLGGRGRDTQGVVVSRVHNHGRLFYSNERTQNSKILAPNTQRQLEKSATLGVWPYRMTFLSPRFMPSDFAAA